jgi:hypothetical protein
VDGWAAGKAGLRIAYSNQKYLHLDLANMDFSFLLKIVGYNVI